MRRNILFGIVLIFFSGLSFVLLNYEKEQKIEEHLQMKTKQYLQNYHTLYGEQITLSEVVFRTVVNTEIVKNIFKDAATANEKKKDLIREALYAELKETYTILEEYNIKQLHFHLPNSESFLRFHRPKKYGDNLKNVRETVAYVNETKQSVHGFEEGRIYNGYRSVFPLYYGEQYIGSVEVSLSTLTMISEFMDNYDVIANFLILKNKIDEKVFDTEKSNYTSSPLKNFCIEKEIAEYVESINKIKIRDQLSEETRRIIDIKALDEKSFSIVDTEEKSIITFIKVRNPISREIVAMFVVKSNSEYVAEKNTIFYFSYFGIMLFLWISLFYIYKELNYRDKEKQLLQQSRLAQMGEMLSMIAHQWRQPLAAISATTNPLILKNGRGKYTQELFDDRLHKIADYSQHLSTTINDFRNFFATKKEKEETSLEVISADVLKIIQISIENKNIKIVTDFQYNRNFKTYKNELKQVLLNLMKNAEDALLEKGNDNPKITIRTFSENGHAVLSVEDNAGGINAEVMEKIFDPYFSTKSEKDGTGLGLYMSKIIVQDHCEGKLNVSNHNEGARFKIILNIGHL